VRARAAVRRVRMVPVEIGQAGALATEGDARSIKGTFQHRRTVDDQIRGAFGDGASDGVADPDGEIEAVDDGD